MLIENFNRNISPEREMKVRKLRDSLRSRAKPIADYWRETRTQHDRKLLVSTRVG